MVTERLQVPAHPQGTATPVPAPSPAQELAALQELTAAEEVAAPEELTAAQERAALEELAATETPEALRAPIDRDLTEIAEALSPGKALDLGCGTGQNSVWLARRGWTVTGVDVSPSALAGGRSAASAAGVRLVLDRADITVWRPTSRFDLVVSTYALPERGKGRSRMLEMAVGAVAPGGTLLISEFDISLHRQGWMAEKYLVSREEIERHLGGFRINRSSVSMRRHRHGYEERVLPATTIVATRRTDLRYAL